MGKKAAAITERTRERWRAKLGIPRDMPREEAERLITLARAKQKGDGSLRDEKLKLEIEKLKLVVEDARLSLEQTKGTLHVNAECEAEWARVASFIRSRFETLAPELVPELVTLGLPPSAQAKARELVGGKVRAILLRIAQST